MVSYKALNTEIQPSSKWTWKTTGSLTPMKSETTGTPILLGPAIKYCWLLYQVLSASLPSTAGFSTKYCWLLYQVLLASNMSNIVIN